MPHSIEISEEAENDILIAFEWYEQQRPQLGAEFIDILDNCLKDIAQHPQYFGYKHKHLRGCAVKKFPYLVLFQVEIKTVKIISVFHTNRNPESFKISGT